MAYIRTTDYAHHDQGPSLLARIGAGIRDGIMALAESSARTRQIEALQRKSDAELAAMGLQRHDIVRHVFRDRFMF